MLQGVKGTMASTPRVSALMRLTRWPVPALYGSITAGALRSINASGCASLIVTEGHVPPGTHELPLLSGAPSRRERYSGRSALARSATRRGKARSWPTPKPNEQNHLAANGSGPGPACQA